MHIFGLFTYVLGAVFMMNVYLDYFLKEEVGGKILRAHKHLIH